MTPGVRNVSAPVEPRWLSGALEDTIAVPVVLVFKLSDDAPFRIEIEPTDSERVAPAATFIVSAAPPMLIVGVLAKTFVAMAELAMVNVPPFKLIELLKRL